MQSARLLIIDDEPQIRKILNLLLTAEGYAVTTAASGEEAVLTAVQGDFDAVVIDLNLPGMDGIATMQKIKETQCDLPFIFITAHGSIKNAVDAIKLGAYNFLAKPFDNDELTGIIAGALSVKKMSDRLRELERRLGENDPFARLIGSSAAMESVKKMAEKVAPLDFPVLVTGESGTGKELVVRAIHDISGRQNKPFIAINCAAIPANLFESEFFGHKKGSFTGAFADQKGKFIEADGGSLFLDEIGEMPLEFQAKLLRVLESGEVTQIGSSQAKKVSVRVLTATNRNLAKEVKSGRFREDLFYRLNVINIQIPPLRQRSEDILLIAAYFARQYGGKNISAAALNALKNFSWPGNVRQLKNEIQRAVIMADNAIEANHFSFAETEQSKQAIISDFSEGFNLEEHLKSIEKSFYSAALQKSGNNRAEAARLLGLSYRIFSYNLDKLQSESGNRSCDL